MMDIREKTEEFIWWEPIGGTSTVGFDNWTNTGPLFKQHSQVLTCHPLSYIVNFLTEGG